MSCDYVYLSRDGGTFHKVGRFLNVDDTRVELDPMVDAYDVHASLLVHFTDNADHDIRRMLHCGTPQAPEEPAQAPEEPRPTMVKVTGTREHYTKTYQGIGYTYTQGLNCDVHIYDGDGNEIAFHRDGTYAAVRTFPGRTKAEEVATQRTIRDILENPL